ncbi:MAG: ATP-binding protein [Myxococcaceae bacterium]
MSVSQEATFSKKVGPRTYESLGRCGCQLLLDRIDGYNRAQLPAILAKATFDTYRVHWPSQDHAKQRVLAFAMGYSRQSPTRGFVLSGPVGTGKTHLLGAALTHLSLERGMGVRYVEISLLYAAIRRGFQEGKSGGEIIGPLSQVEVLAIDELGKGRGSPFEVETLEELIARRYNAGRTTLFATNYGLDDPAAHKRPAPTRSATESAKTPEPLSERVSLRIYSRLCEMCEFVSLPDSVPDHRRGSQGLSPVRAGRGAASEPRRND